MKKISVLLIVLMIITALTSCGDSDSIVSNDNQNGSNVIYEVITAKNFEFYADHSNLSYGESANSIATVFKDSKEQGVGGFTAKTVYVPSVAKTKEIVVEKSKVSFEYDRSDLPDEKYQDVCPKNLYNYVDKYLSTSNNDAVCSIDFMHGTDIVLWYYCPVDYMDQANVLDGLQDDALFDVAEKFLLNFFTQKELAGYSRFRVTKDESDKTNRVIFKRILNGYETEDIVTVVLYQNGKVRSFNACNRGRYNETVLPKDLTKEQIDKVNESALKQLNELKGYTVTRATPQIVMNGKGELFLEYVVEPHKEAAFLESVYVKLTNRLENATE